MWLLYAKKRYPLQPARMLAILLADVTNAAKSYSTPLTPLCAHTHLNVLRSSGQEPPLTLNHIINEPALVTSSHKLMTASCLYLSQLRNTCRKRTPRRIIDLDLIFPFLKKKKKKESCILSRPHSLWIQNRNKDIMGKKKSGHVL